MQGKSRTVQRLGSKPKWKEHPIRPAAVTGNLRGKGIATETTVVSVGQNNASQQVMAHGSHREASQFWGSIPG